MTVHSESSPFHLVTLEQGTPAWLEWRSQGIGASDAPTIMGENPWKTPAQLLDEKCGNRDTPTSSAMALGSALEPEARRRYEARTGTQMAPACMQSSKHAWLRASVDGIALDFSRVVEIKCGDSVYRKTAQARQPPRYYFGQLQHILAVTALKEIDFWCYLPNRPEVLLVIGRDDRYIDTMLERERAFWSELLRRRDCQLN